MKYADDLQLYITLKPSDHHRALQKIEACIKDIRDWMRDNQLVLNDRKTEVLHIRSQRKRTGDDGTLSHLELGKFGVLGDQRDGGIPRVQLLRDDVLGLVDPHSSLVHRSQHEKSV